MSEKQRATAEEAKRVGDEIGVDWSRERMVAEAENDWGRQASLMAVAERGRASPS